jgi:hypothetical protein
MTLQEFLAANSFKNTIATYSEYAVTTDQAALASAQFVTEAYTNLLGLTDFNNADARIAYWVAKLDAEGTTITKSNFAEHFLFQASNATAESTFLSADDVTYNLAVTAAVSAADATNVTTTAITAAITAAGITVPAAETGTLTASVEALATANGALDSFLLASNADGDDDATTASTPAQIATAATIATAAVDGVVTGAYAGSSAAVKAAMISSQEAVNTAALGVAQTTLTEAQAAVTAVIGLTAAVTAHTTAVATTATAATAITTAETASAAGRASFLITNDAQATIDGTKVSTAGAITVDIAGTTTPFTDNDTLTLTVVSAAGVVTLIDAATVAKATTSAATATAEEIAFVEAQQALVTDVVALYNTLDTANDTFDAAEITEAAALQAMNILDLDSAATTDLAQIGAEIVADSGAVVKASAPTVAEMNTHVTALTATQTSTTDAIAGLLVTADTADIDTTTAPDPDVTLIDAGSLSVTDAGVVTATVNSGTVIDVIVLNVGTGLLEFDDGVTNPDASLDALLAGVQAREAADANLVAFNGLMDGFLSVTNGSSLANPLTDALSSAEDGVYDNNGTPDDLTDDSGAQFTIDHLAALVATEVAANAEVTELAALNAAVTAAEATFTDADNLVPVSIVTGTQAATPGNDIYLVDTAIATANITSFGAAGSDSIYLGTEYALVVAGTDETITDNLGSVSALELIVVDNGTDTMLYVENETFAGNASTLAANNTDLTTITLTGVTGSDVSIDANGLVTVA